MSLEKLVAGAASPLLVFGEPLAARLAGLSPEAMYEDAGQWATQVRAASRLLGVSTAAFGGTPCLALEAAGAEVDWATLQAQRIKDSDSKVSLRQSVRWTAFIAALERSLADRSGGAVVARIPGPARMASMLLGRLDDAVLGQLKEVLVQLMEAVCQTRPDLLLLDEGDALCAGTLPAGHRRSFATLRNVARYFDVPVGVAVSGDNASLEAAIRLQPQLLMVNARSDGSLPAPRELASWADAVDLIGVPVNLRDSADTRARLAAARTELARGKWLLTSADELPAHTNIESLRELVAELAAA